MLIVLPAAWIIIRFCMNFSIGKLIQILTTHYQALWAEAIHRLAIQRHNPSSHPTFGWFGWERRIREQRKAAAEKWVRRKTVGSSRPHRLSKWGPDRRFTRQNTALEFSSLDRMEGIEKKRVKGPANFTNKSSNRDVLPNVQELLGK